MYTLGDLSHLRVNNKTVVFEPIQSHVRGVHILSEYVHISYSEYYSRHMTKYYTIEHLPW